MKALVKAGANVSQVTRKGELHVYAKRNTDSASVPLLSLLAAHGASLTEADDDGMRPSISLLGKAAAYATSQFTRAASTA